MNRQVGAADVAAQRIATKTPVKDLCFQLREALGGRLVAYIGGAPDTSTVAAWANGARRPGPDVELRLRLAFRLVVSLRHVEDDTTIQAFFQGMDPDLGERSPATVLRTGWLDDEAPKLLAAAHRLVVGN